MKVWSEYEQIELYERFKFNSEPKKQTRLIALLFCRPELDLMKTDIIPSLPYFHKRSGDHTAFYFAGFDDRTHVAEHWKKNLDDGRVFIQTDLEPGLIIAKLHETPNSDASFISITGPDGRFWIFDPFRFNGLRAQIEKKSQWRYSGGCDMILLNSKRGRGIDFSTAVVLHLDQISELTTTPTVSQLFESIFQYAESQDDQNPTWGLSDFLGLKIARKGLWDVIVGLLPEGARNSARAARNVAVQNIALKAAQS